MGATTDFRVFRTNDRGKIVSEFADACAQARIADGNEYPGSIACFHGIASWHDQRLSSVDEAESFLADKHRKWEGAAAVSFHLPAEPGKYDKLKQERAEQSVKVWEERLIDARKKIVETFMARKSGSVGCPTCKSRLTRSYLRSAECPLCHTNLLSETDVARLTSIEARVKKAQETLIEVRKPIPSENIGWIVGGWCPE